jgi:hypothetical protein
MALVPILVFWTLLVAAVLTRRPAILFLFFGSIPFGSFAVVPPSLTAGLTFTCAPIAALALIGRTLVTVDGFNFLLNAALRPSRLLVLFACWCVAVVVTLFMPRLFMNTVDVVPVRGLLSRPGPLYPTPQNISQLAYLTISILTVFSFVRLMKDARMRQTALAALCFGAGLTVLTGVLDFATQFVPIDPLLAPLRTATYALAVDVEVLGGKRVVGLMPEASAFGAVCLGFLVSLYFLRRSIANRPLREIVAPVLIVALMGLMWLSKSTSAYVGMALFVGFAGIEWLWRFLAAQRGGIARIGLRLEFWTVFAAILAALFVIVVNTSVLDPVIAVVDRMVLSKTESHSWSERGMWRSVAWTAFLDTYGLGVGMGATRASSAHVAVLSNLGLLGAALYYAFIVQTLSRRAPPHDPVGASMIHAVRWAYLPGFVVGFFVGAADFGVFNAFLFALPHAVVLGTQRPSAASGTRAPSRPSPRPAQAERPAMGHAARRT